PRRALKTEKILVVELRGKAEGFPAVSGTDVTGGSCPRNPCADFHSPVFVTIPDVRPGRYHLQCSSFCPYAQYSSSGRKIPSLPNNRTNEMIRGCEIRSISGRRPPPRPFHDDAMEHRLVVHGF